MAGLVVLVCGFMLRRVCQVGLLVDSFVKREGEYLENSKTSPSVGPFLRCHESDPAKRPLLFLLSIPVRARIPLPQPSFHIHMVGHVLRRSQAAWHVHVTWSRPSIIRVWGWLGFPGLRPTTLVLIRTSAACTPILLGHSLGPLPW
jgi:hypothetical protein